MGFFSASWERIAGKASDALPRKKYLTACVLLSIALCASGCSAARLVAEQPAHTTYHRLEPGAPLEQTFTARYDGLESLVILARPAPGQATATGRLYLTISEIDAAGEPLRKAELKVNGLAELTPLYLDFLPLAGSSIHSYRLRLRIDGGAVEVATAGPETYLDGGLAQGGQPQAAQLTFGLRYRATAAAAGLLREALGWLGLLLAGALIYIIPGWALLQRFQPGWMRLPWEVRLGLAAGLSLAVYPLLTLWTGLVSLRLGALTAWLPGGLGLAYLIWRIWVTRPRLAWREVRASSLALAGLTLLIFGVRFWGVRLLAMPLWGDSYQHTMMTQLLVDHGGLFDSWAPYAPLTTFTYHFGFHIQAAALHWVTGLPAAQAVLWSGQLLNGLAVLALIPLAYWIYPGRWSGPAVALAAGLISLYPGFYTNWGRYTQLSGQVILPAAVVLSAWALEAALPNNRDRRASQPNPQPASQSTSQPGNHDHADPQTGDEKATWLAILGRYLPAWIALAGLALSHYRVLIFGVLFFPAWWCFDLIRNLFEVRRRRTTAPQPSEAPARLPDDPAGEAQAGEAQVGEAQVGETQAGASTHPKNRLSALTRALSSGLVKILLIGLPAGLLFLPWFLHVFSGNILGIIFNFLQAPAAPQRASGIDPVLASAFTYLPAGIWLLAGSALAWGLLARVRGVGLLAVWCGLVLLVTNPQWLNLGGFGAITNFAVLIAAYIPVTVLIGAGVARLEQQMSALPHRPGRIIAWGLCLAALALGAWGGWQHRNDIQPFPHSLTTRPDLRASAWIQANLPAGSRFLINGFFAYNGSSVVGSDGGWWLPLTAGRMATIPPLTYAAEQGPTPEYRLQVNGLVAEIEARGLEHPDLLQRLRAEGVTHVYLGQLQGRSNHPEGGFDGEALLVSPNYQLVYCQDQVWIFALR